MKDPWIEAEKRGWHYTGDMNLENGGVFYQMQKPWPDCDWADAVEIIPAIENIDGVYWINVGMVHMPTPTSPLNLKRIVDALSCCDYSLMSTIPIVICDGLGNPHTGGEAAHLMFDACRGYSGVEIDGTTTVVVGAEVWDEWPHSRDKFLRQGSSLLNYVGKEFL